MFSIGISFSIEQWEKKGKHSNQSTSTRKKK